MSIHNIFYFYILCISLCFISCQQNSLNRTFEETLDEFLEVSGTDPRDENMLGQISNMYKESLGDDSMLSKSMNRMMDKMMEEMIPIYKEHYDQQMLEDLIKFYNSPLGKKYVAANKKVTGDALKLGQSLSIEMASEFMKDFKFPALEESN